MLGQHVPNILGTFKSAKGHADGDDTSVQKPRNNPVTDTLPYQKAARKAAADSSFPATGLGSSPKTYS